MTEDSYCSKLDLIIRDNSKCAIVSLDCDICGFLLRDKEDTFYYPDYKSCSDCYAEIITPNLVGWNNGWRPSKKDMEIIIKKRLSVPSYIICE